MFRQIELLQFQLPKLGIGAERDAPTPIIDQESNLVATVKERLMRHSRHRSLKHCWYRLWTGLDHPKLLAASVDEYVKACASGK